MYSLSHTSHLRGKFPGLGDLHNSGSSPLRSTLTAVIGNNTTNGSEVRVGMKRGMNSEMTLTVQCANCYLLSSRLVSKRLKIRMYKTRVLPVASKCVKRDLLL
jgi:hypothetical protein